jgi:hypothetical protein
MPRDFCIRKLLVLAIVAAAPAVSAAHDLPEGQTWAGRKDCQFVIPPDWQDSSVLWDGACAAGKANGQGVLRGYRTGAGTRLFLGKMKQGQLNLGVIEADDGYIAGEFVEGVAVPNPERNVAIKAFDSASAAAKEFSERLKKKKKTGSAAYYLQKAQELEQALD